jgi:hypothetical protein
MAGKTGIRTGANQSTPKASRKSSQSVEGLIELLNDALDSLNRTAIHLGEVSDISLSGIQMLGALKPKRLSPSLPAIIVTGPSVIPLWPSKNVKNHRGGYTHAHAHRGR